MGLMIYLDWAKQLSLPALVLRLHPLFYAVSFKLI